MPASFPTPTAPATPADSPATLASGGGSDLDWLRAAGEAADRRLAAEAADPKAGSEPPMPAARARPGPRSPEPTPEQLVRHLRAANRVAQQAVDAGHHPFGAVLVGPDQETVLAEQGNLDTVNHAEAVLLRTAARAWSADELWNCTLYATVEPCCMCAGTQYWANVGRLVYGMDERRLAAFTGVHPENPTLDLPSRDVFERGHKGIRVLGPVPEVEAEIAALHADFWQRRAGG